MKKNMGNIDRALRVIAGILFGVLFFTHTVTDTLGIILLIVGVVFLLTSSVSFCPLYAALKMSTLKKGK